MAKVILSIKNKICKRRKQKGISMISLVITIIVMIILTVVVFGSSLHVTSEADYSKYVSNLNDVSAAFSEKSLTIKGEKSAESNQKNLEQVYNYVARAGKTDDDFLLPTQIPAYTILKDEKQLGIDLPKLIVESATGKRMEAKYAATKSGKIFVWPPYLYEGRLYITNEDIVETRDSTTITVGNETFEFELDPMDGSLVDVKTPEIIPPEYKPDIPVNPPTEQPKEHVFSEKLETDEYLNKPATCTQPASYFYKCVNCEEKGTAIYQSGTPLGHSCGEWTITKSANCGEIGEQKRTCARCGNVEKQEIEKDSSKHIPTGIYEITKPATCKETGLKAIKCKYCKTILNTENIGLLEHSYGTTTITEEPTCVTVGEKQRVCTGCGMVQKEQIEMNPQKHPEDKIAEQTEAATCIKEGLKVTICIACEETIDTQPIAKTGHEYGDFKTVQAATCLQEGINEKVCKYCSDVQTQTISALGHIDSNTKDNICDRCRIFVKEIPGLGYVEVSNPDLEIEYDSGTGDVSGITSPEGDDPETPPILPENVLPEIIEFGYGNFETKATHTPESYETVSYEETYRRVKLPVAYQRIIWSKWNTTKDPSGNIISIVPTDIELVDIDKKFSTYILYDFETDEYLEMEGVRGESVELWTIYNSSDDSKENIIYLAAYLNKNQSNLNCRVAKWDGTKYVAVDYEVEIGAINKFTEIYTETKTKSVQIGGASSTTEYIYVPSGTLIAENEMTWAEWLESDYNTTVKQGTYIKTTDFEDISTSSTIVADNDYGFMVYELNGVWCFNEKLEINQKLDLQEITFISGISNCTAMDVFYAEYTLPSGSIQKEISLGFVDGTTNSLGNLVPICVYDEAIIVKPGATLSYWKDSSYKTVDFGTTPQLVSEEFYEWFIANATKQ